MQFLDVRTDFAFKRVFGSEQSKSILIDFLNAIIDFGDERITDLIIVDPYQVPPLKGMKDSYVDVKAVLSNRAKVIIEMQVLNVEGFEKRVLYNAAKLYSSQLRRSQQYAGLEPVIALTITDFEMFKDFDKVISYWNLREKEQLVQYSDEIELIFVELPKFKKNEDELDSVTDKWIYFIKNAGSLDFIPKTFTELPLLEAFDLANTAALSEEELEVQFKRRDFIMLQQGALMKAEKDGLAKGMEKGMAKGLEQGMEKGQREAKLAIARSLLAHGIGLEVIAASTGLSGKELASLQEQYNNREVSK
ncbi:Rpn family recombination-promoting nuclease/putative transposase [Candidatus Electronema sp. JC]|uniref:Rpn family recombination-promoting nuclease/putative transposase n=1 Tax=Candidatus Electronema sp. JC TaxID=3401570 RepID=UPI003B4381D9